MNSLNSTSSRPVAQGETSAPVEPKCEMSPIKLGLYKRRNTYEFLPGVPSSPPRPKEKLGGVIGLDPRYSIDSLSDALEVSDDHGVEEARIIAERALPSLNRLMKLKFDPSTLKLGRSGTFEVCTDENQRFGICYVRPPSGELSCRPGAELENSFVINTLIEGWINENNGRLRTLLGGRGEDITSETAFQIPDEKIGEPDEDNARRFYSEFKVLRGDFHKNQGKLSEFVWNRLPVCAYPRETVGMQTIGVLDFSGTDRVAVQTLLDALFSFVKIKYPKKSVSMVVLCQDKNGNPDVLEKFFNPRELLNASR